MAEVVLNDVRKSFGSVDVIHGVDLDIRSGEFVVFVGPSGCGKSTLLRLVAGLENATGGTIRIGERDVTHVEPAERGVAMVFQSYALYPHMNVAENMGFGLLMTGHPKSEVDDKVARAAEILQLDQLLDRKPKALSGGQRQRVAIGRAIVRQPDVFLFDEPLSNLDAELRVDMRLQIAKLHQAMTATMIYVTHDQVEAMTLADKIVVLRAGRVEQVGSPLGLYDDPDNLFVAGFIGSPKMNFLPGTMEVANGGTSVRLADYDATVPMRLRDPVGQGRNVMLGIRPEHFEPTGTVGLDVKVDVIEHLGGASYLYARTGPGVDPLTIERRDARDGRVGETIQARFDPFHALLFDADTGLRLR